MAESDDNENDKYILWDDKVIYLIVLAILLVLFSFIAPFLFSKLSSGIEFNANTGAIGDTIGGIMNPFIAIAGIAVTFLAFYMQLRANQIQIDNFKKELNTQKRENQISQFESQFYEMLRLHKENVNEIKINIAERSSDARGFIYTSVSGRDVFRYFSNELQITYNYLIESDLEYTDTESFHIAYGAFFNGAITRIEFDELTPLIEEFQNEFLKEGSISINNPEKESFYTTTPIAKYRLLQGHENLLGHYYRHLYHSVKFIAHQDEKLINYEKKRSYLRILRAQLSNFEQLMLFYNYLVYAPEWEEENKFLTDYRMIHNLYPALLYDSKYLKDSYDSLKSKQSKVRIYKDDDFIFEAQKHD